MAFGTITASCRVDGIVNCDVVRGVDVWKMKICKSPNLD